MKGVTNTNAHCKHPKLLILDGNDDHWQIIRQIMGQCFNRLTIQRIPTAQQALTLLHEWQWQEWELPQLILMDLYLPCIDDSWELLSQIKAMTTPIRQIPIVMLTASASPIHIKHAYQQGIAAYMLKPTNLAGWQTCLDQFWNYWWETVTLPSIQYAFKSVF